MGAILVLLPGVAQADIGLPMIVLAWPAAWLALVPVVAIEAVVAKRILGFGWGRAARLSFMANLLSTALGIPLAWIAVVIPAWLLGAAADWITGGRGRDDWVLALMAPLYVAWLPPPSAHQHWFILVAAIVLCIPFFFMSRWLEFRVAKYYVPADGVALARRWSWTGNAVTYGLMIMLLAIYTVLALAGVVPL
jgi:hypothetical protein